jgi:hypothetical protein
MKLELILNKGNMEEYLVDIGQLKARIDIYSLNSNEVNSFKNYMQTKYNISRTSIRNNWLKYQIYIHNK